MASAIDNLYLKYRDEVSEFEKQIGLDRYNKYNQISNEQLDKMTAEDCGKLAIEIARFSLDIQNAFNEEMGKVNWANSMIERIIFDSNKSYPAPSAAERRMLAIKDNKSATELEKIRCTAQAKVDRINYITPRIDNISERFSELQETKRGKNVEQRL